ncbi:MAG: 50S ribosomal protein L22 [Armatimonadetes bacterium]|nr:50S ribosomal protein L22 [Armatimonadota bacterium]
MEAQATGKYIRISPHKVRRVVDLIRGRDIQEALAVLKFTPSPAARAVEKVVKSAAANAEHNYEMTRDDLVVSRATVDRGPSVRRVQSRARGRADVIRRHSSHITVVVGEKSGA